MHWQPSKKLPACILQSRVPGEALGKTYLVMGNDQEGTAAWDKALQAGQLVFSVCRQRTAPRSVRFTVTAGEAKAVFTIDFLGLGIGSNPGT